MFYKGPGKEEACTEYLNEEEHNLPVLSEEGIKAVPPPDGGEELSDTLQRPVGIGRFFGPVEKEGGYPAEEEVCPR